jgi:hypothetical protein
LSLKVWKYELSLTDSQILSIPFGAKILSVQVQHGKPMLWALVETDNSTDDYIIRTVATGDLMNFAPKQFLGTIQLACGDLVFHIFGDKI